MKRSRQKRHIRKSLKDNSKAAVIVVFQPSLAGSPATICSAYSIDQSIHPDHIYHSAIKGFASKLEEQQVRYLAQQPHVLRIEIDHIVHTWMMDSLKSTSKKKKRLPSSHYCDVNGLPWGVADVRKPFTKKHLSFPTHLFILDTGISTLHDNLQVLPSHRRNFVPSEQDFDEDLQGHSSHVAGIAAAQRTVGTGPNYGQGQGTMAMTMPMQGPNFHQGLQFYSREEKESLSITGVAPGIQLHSIKVLDKKGNGNMSWVIGAIDFLTQEKMRNPNVPMVANLSLGFDSKTTDYNALDEAIDRAISVGFIFVIAAGNDGANAKTYSPAHVKRAITVGAYDRHKQFADFSNWGDSVDILAPGVDIYSTWKDNSYEVQSGTSMAAPHVSAAACLFLFLHPQSVADEVKYFLLGCSKKNSIKGLKGDTPNVALHLSDDLIERCERHSHD